MSGFKALLADLDGTLVDSWALRDAREARRWKECVTRCGETRLYDDVAAALASLRDRGVRTAVVTSSVSYYASKLLQWHKIPFDTLVAYHDTKLHKPGPQPFLEAIRRLGVSAAECVGVGDSREDLVALRAAGVFAVGAAWCERLADSDEWDARVTSPLDLLRYFEF